MGSLTRLLFKEKKRRVALVGMGGMGKTQLALQLAHWVKENMQYYSVFWASARSLESFEQACGEIIKSPAIQCADSEDPKALVQHYLRSEILGNWLFILDNADDKSILDGSKEETIGIDSFLPDSKIGQVLVVTRSQEVAASAGEGSVVTLSLMSQQESSNLLRESLIRVDELQNERLVGELLQILSNAPLAISQAAAYMNINKVSIETYLGLFKSIDDPTNELLSRIYNNLTLYSTYKSAVPATWMISFNQIQNSHPLAANLLSFIACIEPETIPRSILPDSEPDWQITQAIGILCEYGFLTQQGNNPLFDTHNLVHLATHIWLEHQATANSFRQMAVAHLAQDFFLEDWDNRDLWRQYLPHALKVLRTASNFDRDVCKLGCRVGRCLNQNGRTQEAIRVLEQILAVQSDALPKDDPHHLMLLQELARGYRSDGQIRKAVDLLEYVVAVNQEILSEHDPSRLASEHALAVAYNSNGRVLESIELLEHIVTVKREILAENDPSRLASEHALAVAYNSNGQAAEAIEVLEHTVTIGEKVLGGDHADLLATQHELASAYYSEGQFNKAIELLEKIIAVKGKVYSEYHPEWQMSQRLLLEVYSHLDG
jgi:tetratricopeptide (TPR) repeat protein